MSGDRTSPRYDVVATTRRSWSKQQKKAIVAEIDVGGATLSEVARRHGIHSSLLFRWRKTLVSAMGAAPIEADASGAPTGVPATQRFMPIMLAPPPSLPSPSPTTSPSRPGLIEIVLAGGRTVRVDADVDTSALVRIVEALEKPL
jgi:transposase